MHRNFCVEKWQLFKFLIVYKTHKLWDESTSLGHRFTADQTVISGWQQTMCQCVTRWLGEKMERKLLFKGPFRAYSDRASALTFLLTLALASERTTPHHSYQVSVSASILVSKFNWVQDWLKRINTDARCEHGFTLRLGEGEGESENDLWCLLSLIINVTFDYPKNHFVSNVSFAVVFTECKRTLSTHCNRYDHCCQNDLVERNLTLVVTHVRDLLFTRWSLPLFPCALFRTATNS